VRAERRWQIQGTAMAGEAGASTVQESARGNPTQPKKGSFKRRHPHGPNAPTNLTFAPPCPPPARRSWKPYEEMTWQEKQDQEHIEEHKGRQEQQMPKMPVGRDGKLKRGHNLKGKPIPPLCLLLLLLLLLSVRPQLTHETQLQRLQTVCPTEHVLVHHGLPRADGVRCDGG
jgi:hypothetical protein